MFDPNCKGPVVDDLALLVKCQLCGLTGHSARRCPDFTQDQFSMVKRKRMINFSLLEEIIQHIQSFMSEKEAAQTSILSKSWYNAWLTRPWLDFNEGEFRGNRQVDEDFWVFAKNRLQRYEELNQKIESFRLYIGSCSTDENSMNSLAEELIVKAMKIGVKDLDFRVVYSPSASRTCTLPRVVLESETLIRLYVSVIKLENGKVSWSRLRSLSLVKVSLVDDNIIWDIISSCPLIEDLTLSSCRGTRNRWIRLTVDAPCNLSSLHKLKSLFLVQVDVDPLFFREVLPNFPCLKNLSLDNCGGYDNKRIKLCSRSLECITFKGNRLLISAKFNVPSIRKFEYSGWKICPSVIFTTTSMNWESRISITCPFHTGWFLELQKLLSSLSLSKISLSLTIRSIEENPTNFQGLPKTAVENLMIYASPSARSVCMECLFQICRPKLITLHLLPHELFCRKIGGAKQRSLQELQKLCSMENKTMFGLQDLEEVNVQYFEGSVAEWWRLRDHDIGESTEEKLPKIRFQLRWNDEIMSSLVVWVQPVFYPTQVEHIFFNCYRHHQLLYNSFNSSLSLYIILESHNLQVQDIGVVCEENSF